MNHIKIAKAAYIPDPSICRLGFSSGRGATGKEELRTVLVRDIARGLHGNVDAHGVATGTRPIDAKVRRGCDLNYG
jgi:hypothetical protein